MSEKLYVIKIGGNIVDDASALDAFLRHYAQIKSPKILIHGGGKIATRIGEKLGITSQYLDGRRITDDHTIDLVTMVYGGLVNKKIVAQLQSLGCNAIGLTGADANCIPAKKRPIKTIDYGWVGDIEPTQINITFFEQLITAGISPILAPLTHDQEGHILNTNADTIASSVAVALSQTYQVRLIYCFEKKGVLENIEDENSVITLMDKQSYATLKAANKLFAGILPKLDNAFAAIESGVKEVLIGHADDLITNISENTIGTLIKA